MESGVLEMDAQPWRTAAESERLFRSSDGWVVHVRERVGDRVSFSGHGDGYVMTMSSRAFAGNFKPYAPSRRLRKSKVTGRWLVRGTGIDCYCSELLWNGWAVPHFTLEEGLRIVSMMGGVLEYDSAQEAFIDHGARCRGEGAYRAEYVEVEDGGQSLFAIGARVWCWELKRRTQR